MKSYTIAVTNLPDLYERCFHTNDGKKYVQFALGFHPELAYQYKNQLQKFDKYLETTRYIGEVGLDFTVEESVNRSTQEKIFSHIVQECAKVGNKILTVHSRRAEKTVLDILEGLSACIVILHWYSGSITQMDEALRRGYYFSINHQMLQNAGGRKIVDHIPNDRLLIESDAPFTKKLNKSYSINFMDDIYTYLCERRNITENELSLLLKSNFKSILTKY
jgi:TatD DNase family protein